MNQTMKIARQDAAFSAAGLRLDAEAEIERICAWIRETVLKDLRKRGVVLGLSGGIDSSVTAALCAQALGPSRVTGIFMPEHDSDPESLRLGQALAAATGVETVLEDIGPALAAAGCYTRRDGFIRQIVPEFGEGWGCKVVLENALSNRGYNISWLVVASPTGEQSRHRMPLDVYLGMIAAANMKQRTRKQIEYYHGDRLNYAVAGTPNRLEYDQGFFVKNGDGAADFKPIAHLYKTQVYQLAEALGVPEEIRRRPPTTDTWSLPQGQDEYYFSLPYDRMDICLFGLDHGVSPDAVADAAGLTPEQVDAVWRNIASKRKVAEYLHAAPATML
ncbi:NAD(+) synthase [Pseudorhizobium flavum]|jgi:NAD+ synthase|uniref:NH(3)-dependent NAD(+) synthetase n=1 Tax=Pseudorhizobium flavum TaxID=1335061 RepID=A0A7W9YWN9_9HYPH|nr:NAD(+) synthase [Pseudorhizobium flavum]MBB6179728.1 NAD+ synthase [Pseudorhizobium flavum]CAD6596618.1 NAD(+) synthase [Pseudorhizobium flavum]